MVIVVVSVHAYNIGIVKYDHKILFVVVKILGKEIKQMFVQLTGATELGVQGLAMAHSIFF